MGPTARMTVGAVGTGLLSLAVLGVVLRSVRSPSSPRLGPRDLVVPVTALVVGFGATMAAVAVGEELASPWRACSDGRTARP